MRSRRIAVGDEVSVVGDGHYAGHWGVVQRIDRDTNPHTHAMPYYHVTGGSIWDIAPIFEHGELQLRRTHGQAQKA